MSHGRAYATINGTDIKSCRSRGVDRRIRAFSAGLGMHQTMHSGHRTAPMATITTLDIGVLLTVLDNDECPMVKLASAGLVMVWPKGSDDGPGDATGNVHRAEAIAKGQVYLDSISWSSGDAAEAACTALGIEDDGTTDPLDTDPAAAAPAAVYPDIAYGLVSFTVDGDEVFEMRRMDVRVAHGARNDDEGACYLKSLPHPTKILSPGAGGLIAMELTFETQDLTTAIPIGNVPIVATFQPMAVGDIGLTGDDDVTITMIAGLIIEIGPADGNPSSRTFRCLLRHDGTNRPLTVS